MSFGVLVELEWQIEAADHGLGVGHVFTDVGVYQVVSLEEDYGVEDNSLIFEHPLIGSFAFPGISDEFLEVAGGEDVVFANFGLELPVVFFLLLFELFDLWLL